MRHEALFLFVSRFHLLPGSLVYQRFAMEFLYTFLIIVLMVCSVYFHIFSFFASILGRFGKKWVIDFVFFALLFRRIDMDERLSHPSSRRFGGSSTLCVLSTKTCRVQNKAGIALPRRCLFSNAQSASVVWFLGSWTYLTVFSFSGCFLSCHPRFVVLLSHWRSLLVLRAFAPSRYPSRPAVASISCYLLSLTRVPAVFLLGGVILNVIHRFFLFASLQQTAKPLRVRRGLGSSSRLAWIPEMIPLHCVFCFFLYFTLSARVGRLAFIPTL